MDHTRQRNSPQQLAFLHLHSAAQLQHGIYGIDVYILPYAINMRHRRLEMLVDCREVCSSCML